MAKSSALAKSKPLSKSSAIVNSGTLPPKQRCFVTEYLVDMNATQAAIRAGYPKKSAHVKASNLLSDVKVAEALRKAFQDRATRTEITQDSVLKEYAKLAFSDVRKILTPGGQLMDLHELDDETAAAISSVEIITKEIPIGNGQVDVEYVHKIRFWDKKGALDSVAKHLGMFKELHVHTGPDGGPVQHELVTHAKGEVSGLIEDFVDVEFEDVTDG